MQGAGCRVQGAGCRVQGAGCRVDGVECRGLGVRCMTQGVGWGFGLLPDRPKRGRRDGSASRRADAAPALHV